MMAGRHGGQNIDLNTVFEAVGEHSVGKASEDHCTWLVQAAKVCKDETIPVNVETCGHLIKEVIRQRKTKRSGVE